MKRTVNKWWAMVREVAPHAGAWIETAMKLTIHEFAQLVAPHAGAWIETDECALCLALSTHVAPHAGAWIETRRKN